MGRTLCRGAASYLTAMDDGNAVFAGANNCIAGFLSPSLATQVLLLHP
jgi:hypothetical protein